MANAGGTAEKVTIALYGGERRVLFEAARLLRKLDHSPAIKRTI